MFTASADLYDLIYGSFKNYAAEVAQIAALLRQQDPTVHTVLDVACGTGEHARGLHALGYAVDGLDIDRRMVAIAAHKNLAGRFAEADMCAFSLGRRYDAVLCLFSSIGYAKTLERVTAALTCFRQHVIDGGLVVVEPWLEPTGIIPGYQDSRTVEGKGVSVTRTSHSEVVGAVFCLTFEYAITRAGETRHATEVHELGLFTRAEMEGAFGHAGLSVVYDGIGPSGRGLYLARAAP